MLLKGAVRPFSERSGRLLLGRIRIPETTVWFEECRGVQTILKTDLHGTKVARPQETAVLSGKCVDINSE